MGRGRSRAARPARKRWGGPRRDVAGRDARRQRAGGAVAAEVSRMRKESGLLRRDFAAGLEGEALLQEIGHRNRLVETELRHVVVERLVSDDGDQVVEGGREGGGGGAGGG